MSSFTIALSTVALMLLYSVPGYLFIKCKKISAQSIPAFAVMLLYLCAPFQTLDAMQRIEYSPRMLKLLGVTFGLGALLMGAMLALSYLATRKQQQDVRVRICTTATTFGNCGFMGIPLLEALLPEYPEAVAFASAFFIAMNVMMWTLGSAIITHDRRYIKVRKAILNPTSISMIVSLILFFGRIELTGKAIEIVTLLSKMSTIVCMLILGMRLAAVPLKPIFTSRAQYLAVAMKLIVFPLLALAVCSLLPMERNHVVALYVICAAPVGNVVLSFSEILGEGQDTAANVVLLSTLLSVVTIPFMLLLI